MFDIFYTWTMSGQQCVQYLQAIEWNDSVMGMTLLNATGWHWTMLQNFKSFYPSYSLRAKVQSTLVIRTLVIRTSYETLAIRTSAIGTDFQNTVALPYSHTFETGKLGDCMEVWLYMNSPYSHSYIKYIKMVTIKRVNNKQKNSLLSWFFVLFVYQFISIQTQLLQETAIL